MPDKSLRQFAYETYQSRYGNLIPDSKERPYKDTKIAKPKDDVPMAPDPYAHGAPSANYRSIYEPYPGIIDMVIYESGCDAATVAVEIGKALNLGVGRTVPVAGESPAECAKRIAANRVSEKERKKTARLLKKCPA